MHAAEHNGPMKSGAENDGGQRQAVTILVEGGSRGGVEHRTLLSVVAYVIWQSGAKSDELCVG